MEEGFHCVCLLVILKDYGFEMGKRYYLQLSLEEWKYVVNENKVSNFINDEFEVLLKKLLIQIMKRHVKNKCSWGTFLYSSTLNATNLA